MVPFDVTISAVAVTPGGMSVSVGFFSVGALSTTSHSVPLPVAAAFSVEAVVLDVSFVADSDDDASPHPASTIIAAHMATASSILRRTYEETNEWLRDDMRGNISPFPLAIEYRSQRPMPICDV